MLNEASPLDPKAINNWLDLDREDHLKALQSVQEGKFWPVGFIPDDVVFPTCWLQLIHNKIVTRWLDEQLTKKYETLKLAALSVIDRIEANKVDFSAYGGQAEVNELKTLCTEKP
jgi:hypothetical protein